MNKNSLNIVLDFSKFQLESLTAGQPVAVMPEGIAKMALKALAKELQKTSLAKIVQQHCENLENAVHSPDARNAVMRTSLEFIQERELINNLIAENWDAYKVDTMPKVIGKINLDDLATIADREEEMKYQH